LVHKEGRYGVFEGLAADENCYLRSRKRWRNFRKSVCFSWARYFHTTSGAEQVAQWAVGAKVCKAFNQTGFQNMANPKFSSGNFVMFVCGDDSDSKKIVLQLAEQIGFEAIDAGELSVARLLEPLAMSWVHLAYKANMGRDFAFGILRR
jgi:8-hydroxy-5-deazaflavin:NADPH oxidoreductase